MSLKQWWNSLWEKPKTVMIEPSEPWPRHDVSEPVISFVECVKNNPKRFSVVRQDMGALYYTSYYVLKDKNTNESFEFHITKYGFRPKELDTFGHMWLTLEEKVYLLSNLEPIFEAKVDRVDNIRKLRRERLNSLERNRLTKIYKGE